MKVPSFHSINEPGKPAPHRVYHDSSICEPGRLIPQAERVQGAGGYRKCDVCLSIDN